MNQTSGVLRLRGPAIGRLVAFVIVAACAFSVSSTRAQQEEGQPQALHEKADVLTAEQAWACRWSGGLTAAELDNVLDTTGLYLGEIPSFPDRFYAGYGYQQGIGVIVGFMPGSRGQPISYSLDIFGFDAPDWFGAECRKIRDAYAP